MPTVKFELSHDRRNMCLRIGAQDSTKHAGSFYAYDKIRLWIAWTDSPSTTYES